MGRALALLLSALTACSSGSPAGVPASIAESDAPTASPHATPSASVGSAAPAASAAPTTAGFAPTGPTEAAFVVRVIDGDTVEASIDGVEFTVRYIGIDTPETVAPGQPVQWMGPEASAANSELVLGQAVVLETDVSHTDRFGRLLRYVWLAEPDGGWLLVNLQLVVLGLATVTTFPPDVKYVDEWYLPAQAAAREAGLGVWGPTPEPAASEPVPGGDCDPAYPTVCILPPPPDLDCGEITFRRFTVLAPDPHTFDGDHDGVGCES